MRNAYRRMRTLLLGPLAARLRRPAGATARGRQRLVMTLLVRDEADIIRQNVEFHLRHGVDFIIATVNRSRDGTREILEPYARSGVLRLIDEPGDEFTQSRWVNRMGQLALERHGATQLFHADADEFWFPRSGDLKDELLERPLLDLLQVPVTNILLQDRGGAESFPRDTIQRVIGAYAAPDIREASKRRSLYLFRHPPKVLLRCARGLPPVTNGNHRVRDGKRCLTAPSRDITIYHYPLRGWEQFRSKVINGGGALRNNTSDDANTGWHWRRWYQAYLDGRLEEEYRLLLLRGAEVGPLQREGVIEEERQLSGLLRELGEPANSAAGRELPSAGPA
ncbi:MAG: glycosyltransferase family 2 protein [Gammaproteobacteria bacterium]|nr:glycosyltransferase family 2 protein [Gammaproteobacteria bacterium]